MRTWKAVLEHVPGRHLGQRRAHNVIVAGGRVPKKVLLEHLRVATRLLQENQTTLRDRVANERSTCKTELAEKDRKMSDQAELFERLRKQRRKQRGDGEPDCAIARSGFSIPRLDEATLWATLTEAHDMETYIGSHNGTIELRAGHKVAINTSQYALDALDDDCSDDCRVYVWRYEEIGESVPKRATLEREGDANDTWTLLNQGAQIRLSLNEHDTVIAQRMYLGNIPISKLDKTKEEINDMLYYDR